jgi:SAM-dependent methyltransferase
MHLSAFERQLRAFQHSRILLTAIELDIFAAIAEPAAADDIASRLGTDSRATELLLNALVALGVAEKSAGLYWNRAGAGELLADPATRMGLLHYAHRWNTWSNLTARVRGIAAAEDYRQLPSEIRESSMAMQNIRSTRRADAVAQLIADGGVPLRVLDLGGGTAPYSIALAARDSRLRAEIVELPELAPLTARSIAAARLSDRLRVIPGDIHTTELGNGFDVVLLCSITHLFGPEENRALAARCRQALRSGGRLVIHDHVMNAEKTAPLQGAIFAVNMLLATPSGATYSFEEYSEWLRAAGFCTIENRDTGTGIGLILATA